MEHSVTNDDLNKALKAYIASLPLRDAITFAAGVWGVSFEEALRRIGSEDKPARNGIRKDLE